MHKLRGLYFASNERSSTTSLVLSAVPLASRQRRSATCARIALTECAAVRAASGLPWSSANLRRGRKFPLLTPSHRSRSTRVARGAGSARASSIGTPSCSDGGWRSAVSPGRMPCFASSLKIIWLASKLSETLAGNAGTRTSGWER
eukprot:scaffold266768_cov31-Tisochrysis_lutea.AAC.3